MGFNKITAAEAAALIQNGDTIGLSGFTPAGVPKSVPAEIARKAEKEHAEGKEFKINILTGASTGQSCCLLSTSPSPRARTTPLMPSSA